jgi:hypothetical protein
MKKSTVAAIAAASLLGFGAVGSANADVELSGFTDIQYNAISTVGDGFSNDGQGGNFRASGELDVIQKGDGPTFRADLDLMDVLNGSPQVDIPSGTGGFGVDIEQLYVDIPVMDMASVKAGVFDSPFGFEGQDATDYNFANNGLLWQWVPSVIVGGMVNVAPTDMLSVNLGYINSRADATGLASDNANDFVVTVGVAPMEGVGVNLGYITDNGTTGGTKSAIGDQFDINATVDMVENLSVSLDYQMGDPATTTGNFDNGYGIHAAYTMMDITGAVRYEAASFEGTGPDQTWTSASVSYPLADMTIVRFDWTNIDVDNGASSDIGTIQLVHSF